MKPKRATNKARSSSRKASRKLRMRPSGGFHTVTTCGPAPVSEKFEILELLGQGSFGNVYKIRNEYDGKLYALKLFKQKENGINELNELNLLCSIRHPNLVHMQYFFFEENEARDVGYVLPIADGDLFQYLAKHPDTPFDTRIKWAYQFLSAMSFLQENDIHHCDIKPENCLIIDGNLVVSDFGFAYRNFLREGPCVSGTAVYASPQKVYKNLKPAQKRRIDKLLGHGADIYREQSTYFTDDVWAVAMTMWFMLTNQTIERISDPVERTMRIFEVIRRTSFAQVFDQGSAYMYSEDLGKLFSTLFAISTSKRAKPLSDLLSLPMFRSFKPIVGTVIQGDVVKPIDCSLIDTRPYVSRIVKYWMKYMTKIRQIASEIDVQAPTDDEAFFICFNAVDLFFRTFAVMYRNHTDPDPSLTAIAYVVMSSKLTVLGLNYKNWIKMVFGLSENQIKYVYSIEREVVCIAGGIMSSTLPHNFINNVSEEEVITFLMTLVNNCEYTKGTLEKSRKHKLTL